MFPRITKCCHIRDYVLELTFSDGAVGKVDFADRVRGRGGVFLPLEDVNYFKKVQIEPEAGTIVWPNGVDFCPDVLYSLTTGKPIRPLQPA